MLHFHLTCKIRHSLLLSNLVGVRREGNPLNLDSVNESQIFYLKACHEAIWFLPVIVVLCFEQKKGGQKWYKVDLCANTSQGASKKKFQIDCTSALFGLWFSLYRSNFGDFILCLVNTCITPAFPLWCSCWAVLTTVFGRGNIFPLLKWAVDVFPCDGFSHLTSRHCLVLITCFISNPEFYLSAWWACSWVLQGPPCKAVTIKWMWHYSRDGEMNESKTWWSHLRKCKWLFESCSHEARCNFMIHHQQHSSILHLGHPLVSSEDINELKSLGSV